MLTETNPRKGEAVGLSPNVEAILATAAGVQSLIANGINPDGSLKTEAIRALLKLRNINIMALAEANGFDDSQFHQVLNKDYANPVIQAIIAAAIGLPVERIWGQKAA